MNYDSTYDKAHKYLAYYFGKAVKCEAVDCKGKSKKYQWALLKGCTYEKNRENFWQLCVSCHAVYDGKMLILALKKQKRVRAIKENFDVDFPSIKEAARRTGVLRTSISNVLRGRALTAGGYKWNYA